MASKKNATAKMSLSQKMQELEEITKWFEKDDFDIEKALPKFEEGLQLATECKQQLEKTENRVKEIKMKFADVIEEE